MTLETLAHGTTGYFLRRAVAEDIGAIIELMANDAIRKAEYQEAETTAAGYLAAFHAIDSDPAHFLAVVEDEHGKIVGTMQLTLLPGLARAGATRMQIEAVRVDEELRGRGIGSAMIQWAVAEAKRRGAGLVQLTSDSARTEAHRFYERLGFTGSHVGFKMRIAGE
ncbi:N-acetyltransferase [Glutamicibacter uratoxydans]|uniref:N-acetyltransferase n=1 Tax=Glutamicibacter uratoxydans TaxID=43667 RepID=A0A4Y4DWH7_GLUUR|nr:GNAT family N-acetyltransferase [Glutamicibacter uratoxydans]GED06751.1 N-acetyltransferase [Glutamicibacter uratoxydans]